MRESVLVTGVGGPSGVAAVAALKSKGFTVTGVDMRVVPHEADFFFEVPAALDPAYVPVLRELVAAQKISWLVPTVSEELVKIALAAAEFRRGGVGVYIGAPDPVRICNDKWDTACALLRAGVAVPQSAIGDADSAAVRALGFPLVSRPRVGRGGRGVVVHEAPGVAPAVADTVWQQFMPGTEYDVLMVVHPDAPGKVAAIEVFEKKILKEGRVGNALEVEPVPASDVARLARDAAAALGMSGPMDVDIRRDAKGAPRVLEINARIGAHTLKAPVIFDALIRFHREGHLG
jgi:carbamoylphosphate synthase large subunit